MSKRQKQFSLIPKQDDDEFLRVSRIVVHVEQALNRLPKALREKIEDARHSLPIRWPEIAAERGYWKTALLMLECSKKPCKLSYRQMEWLFWGPETLWHGNQAYRICRAIEMEIKKYGTKNFDKVQKLKARQRGRSAMLTTEEFARIAKEFAEGRPCASTRSTSKDASSPIRRRRTSVSQ
jgi:hypothetical protein